MKFTEAEPVRVNMESVCVLGIGNPWMGDDGAGSAVIALLNQHRLPSWVQTQTANAWELAAKLQETPHIILVDAAQMGLPPGTWKRFSPEETGLFTQPDFKALHEAGVAEGLAVARALDLCLAHVVCYGIEPGSLEAGQGLSPEIKASLPGLVDAILMELWEHVP